MLDRFKSNILHARKLSSVLMEGVIPLKMRNLIDINPRVDNGFIKTDK